MAKCKRPRRREEGGALAFALIAMTAALAIGASAMYVSLGSRRIATRSVQAKNAFFCAELALERARAVIRDNWADRDTALANLAPPVWYTTPPMNDTSGTPPGVPCPGPGGYYYKVTLQDDVDELTTTPDGAKDSNERVIVHAEVFAPYSNDLQARVSALIGRDPVPVKGYP